MKSVIFLVSLSLLGGCGSQAVKGPDGLSAESLQAPQADDLESRNAFQALSDATPGTISRVSVTGGNAVPVQVEKHYWSASGKRCIAILEMERPVSHAICLSSHGLHSRVTVQRGVR